MIFYWKHLLLWSGFLLVLTSCQEEAPAVVRQVGKLPSTRTAKKASDKVSQYDQQAMSIFYDGEGGLPAFGVLNGTEQALDDLPSSIMLNKTKATLNCSSGYMGIKLHFQQPFYGIVYANHDRNSACKMAGNGLTVGDIKLPLKGCGTLQKPARVFTNDIVVRFHPGLEIDGDEVITIVCRYPPPVVIPPIIPAGLQLPVGEEIRSLQPLREFEILLIICAIVFLSLMLLGIGCSYYCLKKRNIRVVRRRPNSTLGSEVTKMSEPISMFGTLKIPRAHAEDTSGTEELTESVQSDFGSDVASTASEDDIISAYSDGAFGLREGIVYPQLHLPPRPTFDVRANIRRNERSLSPISSKASSGSELVLKAQEQYLTTILERTEVDTLETLERVRKSRAVTGPPPVHARLRVANKNVSEGSGLESESEHSMISDYYDDKIQLHTSDQMNQTLRSSRQASGFGHRNQGQSYDLDDLHHDQHRHTSSSFVENSRTSTTNVINVDSQDYITPVIVERSTLSLNVPDKRKKTEQEIYRNNFDVLIRILEPPLSAGASTDDDETASIQEEVSSILTEEEKFRLKEVITQNIEIKQFLKQTYTTEKMLMLKDYRQVGEVIEPQKWEILIRVIDNADARSMTRGSGSIQSTINRKLSSEVEQGLRSVSEISVGYTNFRVVPPDARSAASGFSSNYTQGRSAADRSGTEIVEKAHFINRDAYFRSEFDDE